MSENVITEPQEPSFGTSWHSYPSSYNLGNRQVLSIFSVPVYIEEKVDGSQFSFGLIEDPPTICDQGHYGSPGDYRLRIRSKGAEMYIEAPMSMFRAGALTVQQLHAAKLLHPGWTYRGEFLAKPKHNSLAYDRVPKGNIILFDVATGDGSTLGRSALEHEARRIGLEVVPLLLWQPVPNAVDAEELRFLLTTNSILGGQKVEGVVIKQINPTLYGPDHKPLMAKFVSEDFREVHKQEWRKNNPTPSDIVQQIADTYCTPARWAKAVQHLAENGKTTGTLQDIGPCMKEIPDDILKECKDEMMADLWKHFWPEIKRRSTRGFPEWYKDKLFKESFQ